MKQLYENRRQPPISFQKFLQREGKHMAVAAALVVLAIGIGMVGFVYICGLPAEDAMVDSAMLMSGMGPVNCSSVHTFSGKAFASAYALFCGVVFFTAMGIVLAPVLHRLLHLFHRPTKSVSDQDR